MTKKYPQDQFDKAPKIARVGAHRMIPARGRGRRTFIRAALAVVVLSVVGIVGLVAFNNRLVVGAPVVTAPPTPTVNPTVDPSLTVIVLNGSPTEGLASRAAAALKTAGVAVTSWANADDRTRKSTTVYYGSASLLGAAAGVAALIPGATTALSSQYSLTTDSLVVVLGSDYQPPATVPSPAS